jgi:hypothetical protein
MVVWPSALSIQWPSALWIKAYLNNFLGLFSFCPSVPEKAKQYSFRRLYATLLVGSYRYLPVVLVASSSRIQFPC